MRQQILFVVAAATAISLGCGGGRTTAATQKSPKAFDPAKSDAKAIEAIDAMLASLGGAAAWDNVKQISWETKYTFKGELKAWFKHAWDRWNGRHRFESVDMQSHTKAVSANDNSLRRWSLAMYDLFTKKGAAEYGGKLVNREDAKKIIAAGYKQWQQAHYQLVFHYKVKDPGVVLKHVGTYNEKDGLCKPTCETIKVTFIEGVGDDTYYININSDTKLPEFAEKQGEKGRLAFLLTDWITVNGMKFPGKMQNIGLKDEVFLLSNIKVAEPDDFLYVPRTRY